MIKRPEKNYRQVDKAELHLEVVTRTPNTKSQVEELCMPPRVVPQSFR